MNENQGHSKGLMRGPGRWIGVGMLAIIGGGVVVGSKYLRA